MISLDVRADRRRFAEVHRRTGHRRQLPGRDQFGGDRRVMAGVDHGDLLENVAIAGAGQVEVTVVGQVEHGRFVGAGLVVDAQFVVVGQAIGDFGGQIARETHLAVGREVGQGYANRILVLGFPGLPDFLVETFGAAVQGVGFVVLRHLIAFAIDFESTFGQTVAEAADGRAEVRGAFLIALHIVKTQDDIVELAVFVSDFQRLQGRAVGNHGGLHAVAVAQDVLFDRRAVIGFAESFVFSSQARRVGGKGSDHQGQSEAGEQVTGLKHG